MPPSPDVPDLADRLRQAADEHRGQVDAELEAGGLLGTARGFTGSTIYARDTLGRVCEHL